MCVCVWVCLCLNSPASSTYWRWAARRPAAHNEGGDIHTNHGEPVKAYTSANLMKRFLKINLANDFCRTPWEVESTKKETNLIMNARGIRWRKQGGNSWKSKQPAALFLNRSLRNKIFLCIHQGSPTFWTWELRYGYLVIQTATASLHSLDMCNPHLLRYIIINTYLNEDTNPIHLTR